MEFTLQLGKQPVKVSKSIQASGYRKAGEYLESIRKQYRLPLNASDNLPRKYELVGNVLMIPEDSMKGADWEALLSSGNSVRIWTGLAACFGVSKVARKARVDGGPKRESNVMLLLPPLGQPVETGPGSAGWVEVFENNISYGFDVTRVMFCSGNCTERIRMSKEKVEGEVIVDLYVGVGYYTIPFLLYGKAEHVHACEWNPNSLLALGINLKKAGVGDRCTVYPGDNNDAKAALSCIADRVCLGLLPSSVGGWPLAVSAMKPTGGKMHVHENVNDIDIDNW
eukprot:CAMPEP_0119039050 /NCGR_PEP_ID=MMETSP1177-20130426/8350_1 /TAXON_ID=2985 /ORGANISM="Ochromonas sp, Strain CCMP1899" /LENGTH=281 /DNA_ID=CAMNT_0007002461 /DNA_START=2709 /DNA_END=3551 /DNA_ORIENTATION=-